MMIDWTETGNQSPRLDVEDTQDEDDTHRPTVAVKAVKLNQANRFGHSIVDLIVTGLL